MKYRFTAIIFLPTNVIKKIIAVETIKIKLLCLSDILVPSQRPTNMPIKEIETNLIDEMNNCWGVRL